MRLILICTPKDRQIWRCIFFMEKRGRKNKKYSPEFKARVFMEMREHGLGYRETMRRYKEYLYYYNNEKRSLKLNGMSPVQYRTHSQII